MAEQIITDYILNLNTLKAQVADLEAQFEKVAKKGVDSQKKVDDATKKTAETTKKSSDEYVEAARKRAQSIDNELKNIERLRDQLKKAFSVNDINTFNAAIKEGEGRIKTLKGEVEKSTGATSNFANNLKGIAGALGVAFAVGTVVNFTKEAISLSAKAEGIRTAFARIGNEATLDKLRVATRGATSDIDLMAAALRGKNFNISTDLLAKGLELAGKVARTTGQDVTYLTDSFVDGLGRKSIRILDNLQISQVQLREEVKKTGDFNVAVGNIVDQKLKELGSVSDTTADKLARLGARFTNLKTSVGDFLIATATGIQGFFENIGNAGGSLEAFAAIFGLDTKSRAAIQITAQREATLKAQGEAAKQTTIEFNAYLDSLRKSQGATFNLDSATKSFLKTRQQQIDSLDPQKDKDRIALLNSEINAIEESTKANKNGVGSVEALKEAIKNKKEELEGSSIVDGESLKISKEVYKLEQQLKAALGEETDAQKKSKEALKEKIKAQKEEREELIKTLGAEVKLNTNALNKTEDQKNIGDKTDIDKAVRDANNETTKQLLENIAKLEKADQEAADKKALRDEEVKKALVNGSIEAAGSIADATFTIQQEDNKRKEEEQLNALSIQEQAELSSLDKKKEQELSKEGLTATQRKAIEEKFAKQKEATEAKFAKKETEVKRKAFEEEKKLAIQQALIRGALAAIQSLANTTLPFPASLVALIPIAAATAAEIAVINSRTFAKGTPYLTRDGAPQGVDTIPIMADEGEAIIPRNKNKENPGLANAWINGTLDDYINQNNVMPALREYVSKSKEAEQSNMAKAMADSIMLNTKKGIDEYAMARAMAKGVNGNSINIANHEALAASIASKMNTNKNFF